MLYLETFNFPGNVNMALDVKLGLLSSKIGEPILRVYTWERPTLSIGRHQSEDEVDFRALEELGVDCVRRPTGGRAVLHWEELTYSVTFPRGSEEFSLGVLRLYERISKILAKAFLKVGISVDFSKGKGWNPKNPSCFSSGARYELKIGGRKFVGSAQVRMRDFVLQHGSIMMRPRWDLLSKVLSSHPSEKLLAEKATGIYEVKKIGVRELADSVREAFGEEYGIGWMKFEDVIKVLRSSIDVRGGYSCRNSTLSQHR